MKNYFKILSLLSIATLLVVTSCKKEEDTKSLSDYLTAGNWKVTAMTINPGIDIEGIVITDFYSLMMENCSKDDFMKFNSNGTLIEDEGSLKCDPEDPQTETSNWTLNEDTRILTITYSGGDSETITLVSINETTFVASTTMTEDFNSGPIEYTMTITLTLQ